MKLIKQALFYSIIAAITLTSAAFAVAPIPNLKEKNTLSICSYSEFTPVIYANGKGFEGDLLRAIAKLWEVNIKFYPQKTYEGIWLQPSQPNAKCDIAAGGITPIDYRIKQGAIFTIGTVFYDQSLLVRKKDYLSGRITSYSSFKNTNMKIGLVPGTSGEFFAHDRAKAINLPLSVFKSYESESKLLPALASGKIDAIARGEIGNEYQAALDNNFVTIAKQNFNDSFALAVSPAWSEKSLKEFNDAIRLVTKDGKISYKEWAKNHQIFMEQVDKNKKN